MLAFSPGRCVSFGDADDALKASADNSNSFWGDNT